MKLITSTILVAMDGSPASEKALAAAVVLAANYRAELTALGVVEVPEVVGMIDEVDEAQPVLRHDREMTVDDVRKVEDPRKERGLSRGNLG
jgi:nucleotide-binding universal stress UspA family protein